MSDPTLHTAGVIGWPVAHSRSPRLFDHWFARYGIDGRYMPFAVAPESFPYVFPALARCGLQGVNVTLPHKQQALAMADAATPAAEAIGAANLITFAADGAITADNSDGFGFTSSLRAGAPEWTADRGPALVLGAGGASRALIHALVEGGCPEVRLANRTRDKAAALAASFERVSVVDWEHRSDALADAATVVNATSLGMTGQPPLDLALDAAPAHAVVTDIVYTPLETPLLAAARARGLTAVDGLGMLLHQARPAFSAWFGVEPEVDEDLRAAVAGG